VKALTALLEPIGVNAGGPTSGSVSSNWGCGCSAPSAVSTRPGCHGTHDLAVRSEKPAAPRSGSETRIELAGRALDVADDEGDLRWSEPLERRHHFPESTLPAHATGPQHGCAGSSGGDEADGDVLERDGRNNQRVEQLVVAENVRQRVGFASRVDDAADRVEEAS
jgi:hypothetical protein